jgi:hypothetical protein
MVIVAGAEYTVAGAEVIAADAEVTVAKQRSCGW